MKILIFLTLAASQCLGAAPRHLKLELGEVERATLQTSPRLKAAERDEQAAREKKASQKATRWPRLILEGNYKYLTNIPTISFGAGPGVAFGDHHNYSVGPTLTWTVWDFGGLSSTTSNLESLERAKNQDRQAAERQLRLMARQGYFRVQLALEQVSLVADSLRLAEAQYKDIRNRQRAGASSRLDVLTAHREALGFTQQFRQSQAELSTHLHDLFALSGVPEGVDATLPLPTQLLEEAPTREEPTLLVHFEPIEKTLTDFTARENALQPPNATHPLAQSFHHIAEASRRAADTASATRLPKLAFQARSSFDYPNGPIREHFNQNSVGATLTVPLFDWGSLSHEQQEKTALAESADQREQQVRIELTRDWDKARATLASYRAQDALNLETVKEAEEVARLVYASYRVGRSTLLEVQSANLRALEAKVQFARNRIQILNQLAMLASLSVSEGT